MYDTQCLLSKRIALFSFVELFDFQLDTFNVYDDKNVLLGLLYGFESDIFSIFNSNPGECVCAFDL